MSLPKGWIKVRLGDICSVVEGQVDPRRPEYRDLPHINGEVIESGTGRLLEVRTASEDGLISGKYLFEPGMVLYSKLRPYLRKVTIAPSRGVCSADMYPLKFDPLKVDTRFAMFSLLAEPFTRYAVEESRRARMPKLNRAQLMAWDIPLPPSVVVQRRIAADLVEQLAAAEAAKRAAEERLAAAKALAPAYIRSVFESFGKDGTIVALGDVCHVQLGKMLSPKSKTGIRPVPYLRNENVQWNRFDLADVAWMDFSEAEEEKFRLLPGDLLVCEGGEPGRSAIWSGEIERCCYQKALHRIRPRDSRLYPPFLMYRLWLASSDSEFVDAHSKTTIAHLPMEKLVRLRFALPPIEAQRQAAERLASLLATAANVQRLAEEQLAAVTAIPDALLRATFEKESKKQ